VKEIQLHGKVAAGRVALIDDEDLDLVSQYRWHCQEGSPGPGLRNIGPYARVSQYSYQGGRKVMNSLFMHGLILGVKYVDHIDHDGLNNQRSNLRPTDTALNNYNQRPRIGTSSRFKGVCWNRFLGKWQAGIKLNGHSIHLGLFVSEEEAALAYDTAALDAYGDHAYLNLPGGAALCRAHGRRPAAASPA